MSDLLFCADMAIPSLRMAPETKLHPCKRSNPTLAVQRCVCACEGIPCTPTPWVLGRFITRDVITSSGYPQE